MYFILECSGTQLHVLILVRLCSGRVGNSQVTIILPRLRWDIQVVFVRNHVQLGNRVENLEKYM